MRRYLLDTNVTSELIRRRPDPAVIQWLRSRSGESLFFAAVAVGEAQWGIERLADGRRRRDLAQALDEQIAAMPPERIVPIDVAVAREWGATRARAAASGRTLPVVDAMLLATAAVHGMVVVTRNTADFNGLGVKVVDPWIDA